jgi:PadR family transcriptional regulator PadR
VPRTRRPSPQTIAVLGALAEAPSRWRYGYDLCRDLGLRSGSLYPILMRLAERELVEASWEADPPPGRPPRHMYRLSARGLELARDVVPSPAARALRAQPGGAA